MKDKSDDTQETPEAAKHHRGPLFASARSQPVTENEIMRYPWIQDFPQTNDAIYLNAGTLSLIPLPVMEHFIGYWQQWNREGAGNPLHYEAWHERVEQTRASLAAFCGSPQGEEGLHLTSSVSDALNFGLLGFSLSQDATIITSDQEHPALIAPLTALCTSGRSGHIVPYGQGGEDFLDRLEAILKTSRHHPGLVAVSHVSHMTGAVLDAQAVADLCHRYQVRLLLDGAQALGQVPVAPGFAADAYILNGQKWGLAPVGNAGIYINPSLARDDWHPPAYGPSDGFWSEYPASLDGGWTSNRRKLEYGTRAWPTWMAWKDALEYRTQWSNLGFEEHASRLARSLRQAMSTMPNVTLWSPIDAPTATVTFSLAPYTTHQLSQALNQAGIVHRLIGMPIDAVRLTFGPWNHDAARDQVLAAVHQLS